jgi:transposase
MKKYKVIIGIDVSKSKLDVCILTDGQNKKQFIIENNPKGYREIVKAIGLFSLDKQDCFFCLEHTGVYAMPICYWFEQNEMNYCLVPALEIKRSIGIKRGKSDKADALAIARFAYYKQGELACFRLAEKELQLLKVLMSEREKLVRAIKMFTQTNEMKEFLPKSITKQAIGMNNKTVKFLQKQQKEIEGRITEIIENNPLFKNTVELAKSVPGVGDQTAITLMITTRCFTRITDWRKMACHAGVAPFEYTSGTSVHGKTKVNQMANKKLKVLLNLAALSAKKYDDELRLYYERKVSEGKNGMSVMNAIRCKVLSRVYATVKRGTPYVPIARYAA